MATHARERIVESAITLSRRGGVSSLTVADVLAGSGVAKRSFYNHFPGGVPQLAVESTRAAANLLDQVVAQSCELEPREAIVAFVDAWIAVLAQDDFTQGCPIASAALARATSPEAADEADATFRGWEDQIVRSLVRAGLDERDSRTLAVTAVCTIEGAVVRCLAARSSEPLSLAGAGLAELLGLHLDRVERPRRRPRRKP